MISCETVVLMFHLCGNNRRDSHLWVCIWKSRVLIGFELVLVVRNILCDKARGVLPVYYQSLAVYIYINIPQYPPHVYSFVPILQCLGCWSTNHP